MVARRSSLAVPATAGHGQRDAPVPDFQEEARRSRRWFFFGGRLPRRLGRPRLIAKRLLQPRRGSGEAGCNPSRPHDSCVVGEVCFARISVPITRDVISSGHNAAAVGWPTRPVRRASGPACGCRGGSHRAHGALPGRPRASRSSVRQKLEKSRNPRSIRPLTRPISAVHFQFGRVGRPAVQALLAFPRCLGDDEWRVGAGRRVPTSGWEGDRPEAEVAGPFGERCVVPAGGLFAC